MTKSNQEFNRFDAVMGKLLSVPHSEIKAKLDAEKKVKAKKKESEAELPSTPSLKKSHGSR
jgi:hypothetical protein